MTDHTGMLERIEEAKQALLLGQRVMAMLAEHGPSIVPHLMDTDENAGERFRQAAASALAALEHLASLAPSVPTFSPIHEDDYTFGPGGGTVAEAKRKAAVSGLTEEERTEGRHYFENLRECREAYRARKALPEATDLMQADELWSEWTFSHAEALLSPAPVCAADEETVERVAAVFYAEARKIHEINLMVGDTFGKRAEAQVALDALQYESTKEQARKLARAAIAAMQAPHGKETTP